MTLNRRTFIGTGIATAAVLNAPMLRAQTKPRVVVIGGGMTAVDAAVQSKLLVLINHVVHGEVILRGPR